jgi:alpha-D-xyloside xylohydrolase
MKFDHGTWRLLPGTQAIYPRSITDIQIEPDALTVMGYDRVVRARWDYLDGAMITARFTSPMPNVIRVQLTHFKGRRERLPAFDLDYSRKSSDVSTGQDENSVWFTSGDLSVILPTNGDWRMTFTRSEPRAVGLFTQEGKTYLREQLSLGVGETVYGLGERFGAFVKNGQSIDCWNADGGTNSELAYKNIPFYITNQGYGVLVNHPGRVAFEVASHNVSRVQFSAEGHSLDYYIFGGPTMKEWSPADSAGVVIWLMALHLVHHQLR